MPRNRKSRQSLSYGSLEPKRLLAGNVRANVQGDQIFIRGDLQDNQIRIFATEGKIRIQGLNGTTVNRGGTVTVENSEFVSNGRINSEFSGGLRIHMGPGNDFVEVDGIRLNQLSNVFGGTGNDEINISSTDFFANAVVQTFTGDDSVSFTDTNITDTLFALTLDGDDSLTFEDSQTLGGAVLATGDGDDFLRLAGNQHLGAQQLALTQDGNDVVELENLSVGTGSLEIYTGNGDDEVTGELLTGDIGGILIVAGQGDTDSGEFDIRNDLVNRVSLRGFEFDGEVVFQNAQQVDVGFATFLRPNDSFFVADFVEFERTTRISAIDFLGSYEDSTPPLADNLVIDIFAGGFVDSDVFGTHQAPVGAPLATFNVGNNANRTDTGQTWSNFDGPRRIFSFSADVDFTLAPNTQYWISIYSLPPTQGPDNNNNFYTLGEDVPVPNFPDGAANVNFPNFTNWVPNTSAKTHFTLRS